jgi:hypothetical protein
MDVGARSCNIIFLTEFCARQRRSQSGLSDDLWSEKHSTYDLKLQSPCRSVVPAYQTAILVVQLIDDPQTNLIQSISIFG